MESKINSYKDINQSNFIEIINNLNDMSKILLLFSILLILIIVKQRYTIKNLKDIKKYTTNILNIYQTNFIKYIEEVIFKNKTKLNIYTLNFIDYKNFINSYTEIEQIEMYKSIYKVLNKIFSKYKIYIIKDTYNNILIFQVQSQKNQIKEVNKIINSIQNELYKEGVDYKEMKKHLDMYVGVTIQKDQKTFKELFQESFSAAEVAKINTNKIEIYQNLQEKK